MISMRVVRTRIALVLAVNTLGAVIPAVVLQLFRPDPSWRTFGIYLAYSLIYAHSIGTLAFAIMDRVAPRLFRLPRVYTVAGLVLALVSIAVAGSLIANGMFVALGMSPAGAFWPQLRFGLKITILSTVLVGCTVTFFEGL